MRRPLFESVSGTTSARQQEHQLRLTADSWSPMMCAAFIYSLVCENTFSAATAEIMQGGAQINTHMHIIPLVQSDVCCIQIGGWANTAEEFSFRI